MNKIEVRCCCQPQKLLGWLRYRGRLPHVFVFTLMKQTLSPFSHFDPKISTHIEKEEIRLPVEVFCKPFEVGYLAVKAEHTPIETLRKIPDFEENNVYSL